MWGAVKEGRGEKGEGRPLATVFPCVCLDVLIRTVVLGSVAGSLASNNLHGMALLFLPGWVDCRAGGMGKPVQSVSE